MADKKDNEGKKVNVFVKKTGQYLGLDDTEELEKILERAEGSIRRADDINIDAAGRVTKKADGGMVLKQATDDRNGTPNKSVCRGGGAAIKGIKFSGVK